MTTASKREGFWASSEEPYLPIPYQTLDPDWTPLSITTFISALDIVEAKAKQMVFKGMSTCRMCGTFNGNIEFTYKEWTWPSGYRHYIVNHWVKPSDEFLSFIMENCR